MIDFLINVLNERFEGMPFITKFDCLNMNNIKKLGQN